MFEDIDLCYLLWLLNGELGDNEKFYTYPAKHARENYHADVGFSPENKFLT